MKSYHVEVFTTGCFSGTLNPKKLQESINRLAGEGWRLRTTISEEKRVLLLFTREAHFLIFERDNSEAASHKTSESTTAAPTTDNSAAPTPPVVQSSSPPPLPQQ